MQAERRNQSHIVRRFARPLLQGSQRIGKRIDRNGSGLPNRLIAFCQAREWLPTRLFLAAAWLCRIAWRTARRGKLTNVIFHRTTMPTLCRCPAETRHDHSQRKSCHNQSEHIVPESIFSCGRAHCESCLIQKRRSMPIDI